MKTINDLNNRKIPIVRIDRSLEELKNKTLFPEKLAKANEMLKNVKLPSKKK